MASDVETAQQEVLFLKELEGLIGKGGEGCKAPKDSDKKELSDVLSHHKPFQE